MDKMDKVEQLEQNCWTILSPGEKEAVHKFSGGYIKFLNESKTERESVDYIYGLALEAGFIPLEKCSQLNPGQRIVIQAKGKVCALIILGHDSLEEGVNIVASHIDSPRLDLKARPLYEEEGLAWLKTHYYGGIKKYQWLAIPLAMHGVVIKKNGEKVNIVIGENPQDPVLTIADLLPHLAKEQMEKKMSEAISGEGLNALVGSIPLDGESKNPVKGYIMQLLSERYGIEEEDFTSAELELVPAFPAREVGLDRSLIGGYGQDDRVSAYASLQAALEVTNPARTVICLFADKEEIGSVGNTGLHSLLLENLLAEILHVAGINSYLGLRRCLAKSYALSADVNAAVDPNYPEVFEKRNCSFLSRGVVLTKYTGSRGKAESNDANPEFLGRIRKMMEESGVCWQVGELGKVDIGGGGTVAQYLAYYGMEVLDCGVAVMGMHSPFEIVSKVDLYMSFKAYRAFMQAFK
jgi:aspartyl aminopeptidase